MSIASLGIVGGLAGTTLPQRAAEVDRVERDGVDEQRAADGEHRAERAGGIGETEEDSQTSDRDADGRRPWERAGKPTAKSISAADEPARESRAKDPHGECGGSLDLVG